MNNVIVIFIFTIFMNLSIPIFRFFQIFIIIYGFQNYKKTIKKMNFLKLIFDEQNLN